MTFWKKKIIQLLIEQLLELFPEEKIKEITDELLDKIEDKVKASESGVDDIIALPIIEHLRKLLNIKDEDYGSDKE